MGSSMREEGRARQLADPELGGHFHGRGRAHRDAIGFVLDGLPGARTEGSVSGQPPDQRVGVE